MATKIYKLNQKRNSATFNLPANDGKMQVTYVFKDGNQFMPNMPARCTLRSQFAQDLLENSVLFRNGVVKLERVLEEGGKAKEPEAPKKKQEEEITSPEQAIEYVFNTWGITVMSGKQAAKIASQKGVEFPNLKERNQEK